MAETKGRKAGPSKESIQAVEQVKKDLGTAQLSVLVNLRDVPVLAANTLRGRLRGAGASCRVIKNTFLRKALSEAGFQAPEEALRGPTALVWTSGDPVAPSKILTGFLDEDEALLAKKKDRGEALVKAGFLGTKAVDAKEIARLAKLPSREQLLAQAAGLMQAPVVKLGYALNAVLTQAGRAFGALLAQKQKAAGGGQ